VRGEFSLDPMALTYLAEPSNMANSHSTQSRIELCKNSNVVLNHFFMPGFGGKLYAITKLLSPTAGARILLVTAAGYILSSLLGYAKGGVAADYSFGMSKSIRGTPPFSDFLWVVIVGRCGTKTERLPHTISPGCDSFGYNQPGGLTPVYSVNSSKVMA